MPRSEQHTGERTVQAFYQRAMGWGPVLGGGLIVLVVIFGGLLSRSWIEGTIAVTDYSAGAVVDEYGNCYTPGKYSDIGVLTRVTVRDERGAILGSAPIFHSERTGDYSCRFFFTVEVSSGREYYAIGIEGHGEEIYARSALEHSDWAVSLGLGYPQ